MPPHPIVEREPILQKNEGLFEPFQKAIDQRKEKHLLRRLVPSEAEDATHIQQNGRSLLLFCSNNYLGLTHHPAVKMAAIAALQNWGAGSGASRLLSGNHPLYTQLEASLAQIKATESALVFSSGYMANIGVLGALIDKNDLILSDRLNHASLIDGGRRAGGTFRIYPHRDMKQLHRLLAGRKGNRRAYILTDGIFSMEGDIAPLPEILHLAEAYDALIYLDDAHATGVLGQKGGGTCDFFEIQSLRIIQMGTLSKALGSLGGFVAGSDLFIQYLVNKARPLIYTTALPPSLLAAALSAIEIIRDQPGIRHTLSANIDYFCDRAASLGFDLINHKTPIIPIQIGESEKVLTFSQKLLDQGIYVPAIRPPTVPLGTDRLRISLTASHTKDQINTLLFWLEKIGKELKIL